MTIRILRKEVEETEAYRSANHIRKKLLLSRDNIKSIENGVNVCKNVGVERWMEISNFSYLNELIVLEIVKNKNHKNIG